MRQRLVVSMQYEVNKKEDGMANYSEVIVFFLLVPVLMQIILPLVMLAGYGFGRMVNVLFKRWTSTAVSAGNARVA